MNEITTYAAIAVGALLLALVIPGVKVLAEAILKGLFELVVGLFKHKGTFVVWFIKTLFADHARVIRHAFVKRDVIDPTQKVRRQIQGYRD